MTEKSGLSLVEVLVAVAIMSLAMVPLTGLLSSSNRMSNASVYEEMAVHYAREIADQLLNLSPRLSGIVDDAREITADISLDFGAILNDSGFAGKIVQKVNSTGLVNLEVKGRQLPAAIMLSPLNEFFNRRRITATPVDNSGHRIFRSAKIWKVLIELAWVDPAGNKTSHREISTIIFLREG